MGMQAMASTRATNISTADLQYAEEVLEVYRMGDNALVTLGTRDIAPSFRRLYEWAQNPENYDTFIRTMVPKATDILSKHRAPEEQGAVIVAEKKGVAELQEFLRQHVEISQKGRTNDPTKSAHTWANRNLPSVIHPSIQSRGKRPDKIGGPDPGSGDQRSTTEQSGAGNTDGV